jgi:threonine/homoserine/homoserine lactone efflux protein
MLMRHSRGRRRVAAGLYAACGLALIVVAWVSLSVVLLIAGMAVMPLAAWALKNFPVDRDW